MGHYPASSALKVRIMPIDVCPVCKGTGFTFRPPQGSEDLVYPPGTKIKNIAEPCPHCHDRIPWLRKHCGLEPHEQERKLHHWNVSTFQDEEHKQQRYRARSAMKDFIEDRRGFLTFWGDFGSGKTLALQIIVNELRDLKQIEGYYAPFVRILEHLLSLIRDDRETSRYWQRLLDVPVLAIDEVTRFKATEWAHQKLFDLVDLRYRRKLTHLTIFATNGDPRIVLPPDDARGYLYSRMREGQLCELRGDVRSAVGE